MEKIFYKKTRPNAVVPKRASPGSAGYDLCACLESELGISPGATALVPTGISIELPSQHCVAYIFARSSLGTKKGIIPANCVGVIDSDYRGEIYVSLYNRSGQNFAVRHGDRIAQMVLSPVFTPELEAAEALGDTERGSGGFGSTGI
ncbi:MAG: dUTP diphosphatase [Oscillospiraceae bacterium]|nr:dUTP diphosphatase [Oscillospiraceae bacterium]